MTVDKTVRRETLFVAAWVGIFSLLMQAVFLVIGAWDYRVLLGNLLSGVAIVLNFLAMGITVQKAIQKEEKDAKQAMRASGLVRLFILFIVGLIGVLVPIFSAWTVIIPLFFPRFIIALRPLWDKELRSSKKAAASQPDDVAEPAEADAAAVPSEEAERKEDSEHEA